MYALRNTASQIKVSFVCSALQFRIFFLIQIGFRVGAQTKFCQYKCYLRPISEHLFWWLYFPR